MRLGGSHFSSWNFQIGINIKQRVGRQSFEILKKVNKGFSVLHCVVCFIELALQYHLWQWFLHIKWSFEGVEVKPGEVHSCDLGDGMVNISTYHKQRRVKFEMHKKMREFSSMFLLITTCIWEMRPVQAFTQLHHMKCHRGIFCIHFSKLWNLFFCH